jgi:PhzF family phenazine biosynthesis protein
MEILRYAAFSSDPHGGNPAGVVLDARGATADEMLAAAAEMGYSESAFLVAAEPGVVDVRYYSPLAEVAFCGHATIAAGVAWAHRHGAGSLVFRTRTGPVEVVTRDDAGRLTATLTSVEPSTAEFLPGDFDELMACLDWKPDDLDPAFPPRVAYAGVYHPILATKTADRLADLDYDFDRLQALMIEREWTTVDLLWRESRTRYQSRNAFPPGGVVEDPATGASAAAFGGYLREFGLVSPPARVTILQGERAGRPSVLTVDIPTHGGISVTGTAVRIG